MVEVFKTDVKESVKAEQILTRLINLYPDYTINFDLDDCDKILRVENRNGLVEALEIIELVSKFNHAIELLQG